MELPSHAPGLMTGADRFGRGRCGGVLVSDHPGDRVRRRARARTRPISTMERPCSMPAAARPATPLQTRRTRPSSVAGLALKSPFGTFFAPEHLARSRRTASAAGARRISSPRCGRALRRTAVTTIRFSLQLVPADEARRMCATCSPISRLCRRSPGSVRDHDLPFPFKIRRVLGGWKFLFLDGRPFDARADQIGGVESRRLSRQ